MEMEMEIELMKNERKLKDLNEEKSNKIFRKTGGKNDDDESYS
jgi:hypothetical protein